MNSMMALSSIAVSYRSRRRSAMRLGSDRVRYAEPRDGGMRIIGEPTLERHAAIEAAWVRSRPWLVVLRVYPALGNSAYRLLWMGMLPATLAGMMNQVASPYTAF